MEVSDWHKLYGEGWTGLIVPEAFAHPAKYSRALIRHIYQHLIDEGWLEPGATVIDPFAGVALGALHAMKHGLNWVGVELEEKFVDLGQQNVDLWNSRFSQLPGWGSAVILQGDSRRLAEVVGEASGCVSSPPYIESLRSGKSGIDLSKTKREGDISHQSLGHLTHGTSYGTDPANLGNMPEGEFDGVVASPPYVGSDPSASHVQGHSRLDPDSPNYRPFAERSIAAGYNEAREYGPSEGQLANMPAGNLDAVVASPPYIGSAVTTDGDYDEEKLERAKLEGKTAKRATWGTNKGSVGQAGYGQGDGQLANMPAGNLDAVVASPPYAGSLNSKGNGIDDTKMEHERGKRKYQRHGNLSDDACYGNTDGQLAALPEGEFDAVVSSPPYAARTVHDRGKSQMTEEIFDGRTCEHGLDGYGQSDGQLATLPEGEFEACVSSPPWMYSHAGHDAGDYFDQVGGVRHEGLGYSDESPKESTIGGDRTSDEAKAARQDRAENVANLSKIVVTGNQGNLVNTETFWSAARQIVQQVYQLLAPGAPAVWVVKSFVRNKKLVDFPNQWRQLCESVGFETVHLHRAWLVEDRGSQFDLFGQVQENKVERKSFFRRLHEQNASAKMYWEQHVTDRDARAGYLWRAKAVLWAKYRHDLAEGKEGLAPITPPTRSKIVTGARSLAYKGADEPWMDIDTRIDWEVVLCQCKPTGE